MFKSTMMLMTIFLAVSCASCKKFTVKIICKEIRSAELIALPFYDVSFKYNRCRGRCFDFNQWAIRPLNDCKDLSDDLNKGFGTFTADVETTLDGEKIVTEGVDYPLNRCEGVGGFTAKDLATEVGPKIKKLNNIKDQFCP